MTSAQSELFHTVLVYVICLRRERSNRFAFNRKRSEWDWTISGTYKDVEFLCLLSTVWLQKNCLTIVFLLKLSDNPRENLCGWHLSLKLFLKWNLGFNLYWPKSRCCSKRRQDLVYQDCTVWCPTGIDTRTFYFQPTWFWSSKTH